MAFLKTETKLISMENISIFAKKDLNKTNMKQTMS